MEEQVIALLSQPPFSRTMGVSALDAMNGNGRLELLDAVLLAIDASWAPAALEPPDVIELRVSNFIIRVLALPLPRAKDGALGRGERDVLVPLTLALLQDLPALCERAYASRYLTPEALPTEAAVDPSVAALLAALSEAQAQLGAALAELRAAAPLASAVASLKREVAQLEGERTTLGERVGASRRRAEAVQGFPALLHATTAVRREQEEAIVLTARLAEQKEALEAAEARAVATEDAIAAAHAAGEGREGDVLLADLRTDAADARLRARADLPTVLRLRRARADELRALARAPTLLSDAVSAAEEAAASLAREVATAAAHADSGDTRRAASRRRLREAERELARLELQLLEGEREASDLRGDSGGSMDACDVLRRRQGEVAEQLERRVAAAQAELREQEEARGLGGASLEEMHALEAGSSVAAAAQQLSVARLAAQRAADALHAEREAVDRACGGLASRTAALQRELADACTEVEAAEAGLAQLHARAARAQALLASVKEERGSGAGSHATAIAAQLASALLEMDRLQEQHDSVREEVRADAAAAHARAALLRALHAAVSTQEGGGAWLS